MISQISLLLVTRGERLPTLTTKVPTLCTIKKKKTLAAWHDSVDAATLVDVLT